MWKSFFLASGFFLILLGLETLAVQKFVMSGSRSPTATAQANNGPYQLASWNPGAALPGAGTGRRREINTRDWMPWSLLAAGAITVLYTLSLPKRSGSPGP